MKIERVLKIIKQSDNDALVEYFKNSEDFSQAVEGIIQAIDKSLEGFSVEDTETDLKVFQLLRKQAEILKPALINVLDPLYDIFDEIKKVSLGDFNKE